MLIWWGLDVIIIKETPIHIHFKETSSSVDEDGLYC